MVERDVVLAKVAAIDRSLRRIAEVSDARDRYPTPRDADDLIVLHLQRASQSAIDLATHAVASEGYGLPASLADSFTLLEKNGVIDAELALRMRKMVGFRNVAVHQYEEVDGRVVEAIVSKHLGDLESFVGKMVTHFGLRAP